MRKIGQSRRQFIKTTIQTTGIFATGLAMTGNAQESNKTKIEIQSTPSILPERKDVSVDDTWDLSSLFKDDTDCKAMLGTLKAKIADFKNFEGKLSNATSILDCFKLEEAIDKDTERVMIYAYLRSSEDLGDPVAQELKGLSDSFYAQCREATSFIMPELLAIDENRWKEIAADKNLDLYGLKLHRIARQRPHTLSKDQEQLLAMMTEVSQTASKTFNLLNNADLKFGSVQDETGKEMELSTSSFVVLMNSPNREVRKKAFDQFYAGYQSHENTIGSLLGSSIQKDVFYARARKYPSALESALFNEEIPRTVYNNLVKTVNDALPTLYRYYELRRKTMGIDSIHMYDVYIPILSDIKTNYSWDEAVETICKATAVLGDQYVETMREGLTTHRWCDRYENKGKRSGAFSYGSFSAMPYILMNYKSNVIDGMFTLAHEAGHSMHSYYSAKTQPFIYYDYVTFVAEVASTFNEDLLARHLMRNADDNRMKAWLVNRQIDSIRQTLFRQTMFAEFEQRTHEAVEAGQSLTSKSIQDIYYQLLLTYFGPKFTVDKNLAAECLRVPHFYRAFYVYKYATGISAALALAERVSGGGEKERNDYLKFLSGGSSATPIELLRTAGVDMESPEPIQSAMRRFADLVDQLEKLILK